MNILVTGCGGDIGLSIGNILKQYSPVNRIVGTDISQDNPGSTVFSVIEIIPPVNDDLYINSLKAIFEKYNINIIIPTSEPELRFFSLNKIRSIEGVHVLMANTKALEIGFDKYLTYNFLKSENLLYPWTSIVKDTEPVKLPCIIKSREGAGGRSVNIVQDEFVSYYKKNRPDDLWQELLLPENEEYTCGLYRCKNNEVRSIIFRRNLNYGVSVSGEVVYNSDISKLLSSIAESIELYGSINVQLRLTERGPVVFEINPRFSSTVMFRHLLGFQDLIWSINEFLGENIESYNQIKSGVKFYRYFNEYIKF